VAAPAVSRFRRVVPDGAEDPVLSISTILA
jgi:hypothetical protein